ncbi:hypothetical protein [Mycobacterium sp.]|uniref:hypothetical protein n=1 Tax=Mycobacterium sp. TaxID=1785 RepID=UPI003F9AE7FC
MSVGPVEPISPEDMPGASDWGDEDLLTIAEASERLAQEIDAARRRIRHAEEVLGDQESPAAATVSAERKRLADLMSAAERIRAARAHAPK